MAEAVTVGATLRTGWPVLVIPSAIYFVSHFHRIALGVVAQDLMRAFTITAATLGALAAIYPYVFVAMALVAGSLADTLGPRRTLGAGALAMGLGALVFGLAPSFSVVVLGRLVVSIGASVILIAFLTLAAERFRADDFATISGLTQTVGNLGGVAAAGPLALLVEAIGWRASFEAIGAVTVALAVVAVLGVRERRDSTPRTVSRSVRDVVVGIPGIVLNPGTWPPVLAGAGMYSTVIALQGLWGVSYLTQVHGLPRVQAAADIAWMAVGVMVGAPLVGRISDRWLGARRPPFLAFSALGAAGWLPLVVPALEPPIAWLPAVFFLLGFSSSGLILVWPCVREVNDPTRVGVVVGFCNIPMFLFVALMQWLTGLVLDAAWTGLETAGTRVYSATAYRAAFGLCLAVAVGAVALAACITETRCRNVWRVE